MSRALFALLWTAFVATAQFSDIAVTDDGNQIYFVSSLPLRGESGGGIFRWTGGRFERFESNPPPPANLLPGQPVVTRGRPVISGGGTTVAWSDESRLCSNSLCMSAKTTWTSTLLINGGPAATINGRTQISRNGRYLLSFHELNALTAPHQLRDLTTGLVSEFGATISSDTQALTSDGRVLTQDNRSLILWSRSGSRRIGPGFPGGVISDNGARIVAVSANGELVAIGVETGDQVPIGPGDTPVISNDGLRVVFRYGEPTELWVASTITGERRQLTDVGAPGIGSASLAGFGETAFAAANDGRILRINVSTGVLTELIPHTPILSAPAAATPCDAIRLNTRVAGPKSLEVTLDGASLPILSRKTADTGGGEFWVQVPCELTPSETPRKLEIANDSPFDSARALSIRRVNPVIYTSEGTHQDFSGPVTRANPARPGEILHLWGTGFGTVDRLMRTGEPGPGSPPAKLVDPIWCRQSISSATIETTFVGLAPGLTGIYQLDMRVPSDAQGWLPVTCHFADNSTADFRVPFIEQN